MDGPDVPPKLFTIDRHAGEWLKGIAILLMLIHHLFGLPTLIEAPNRYIPILPGIGLEYWLGRFGKICVAIFLLLSGYGFAVRMRDGGGIGWAYFADKAWRFLLAYWPYFLLAFTIGSLFFQERMANGNLRFPTDPAGIVLNALTLKNSFAFEWWFAETYLLLVLLTRPLLLGSRRPIALLGGSMLAFIAGAAMDVTKFDPTVISFANLLIWQLPWVVGILAAGPVSADLSARLGNRKMPILALGLVALGFVLVEIVAGKAMTPYLILAAPLVVFGIVGLFGQTRSRLTIVLAWFGRLTLGLWLVHPFFCYYFVQEWIYAPLYSPLVFAALLIASLAVVLPVEGLRNLLGRAVRPTGAAPTAR